jgi:hypothetical protein
MAMDADRVIKSFDVFKDQPVGLVIVLDSEPVKPFALYQGMKGFNAGVIIRITLMAVAELKFLCGLTIRF